MGFMATRVMEVVFKQTGGVVWKNWPMNHTRRANAKKRHRRLRQVEDILRACAASEPVNHVKKDQAQAVVQAASASASHNARVAPSG